MRKLLAALMLLLLVVAFPGCGKKEEESTQPISAAIDNNSPAARNAPSAPMDESPGALAARMGGKGLKKGPQ